jgi:hypothetical protein
VGRDAPTIGGAGLGGLNRLGQLTGVDDTGDTQRSPEGASSLRQCETVRIKMQMRSPTGPPTCRIWHHPEQSRLVLDRDNSEQF